MRDAVEGCVRRKVKVAVIFASGFAEVGSDGVSEQDRIGEIARAGGVALVGPNCLGFMNFVDGFAAVFFSPQPTPRLPDGTTGAVAIVAQSGGLGNHLEGGLTARGVPVSCWISTGNEAGLGLGDFIHYLLDDPVTQVIALYAEDIRRPQEFIDIAGEALRRGKPIVMMHPGRGAKAKEAARSHTGALTGDHAVMRTLVERAGVVVVDTLDELMDVSEIACPLSETVARRPRHPDLFRRILRHRARFLRRHRRSPAAAVAGNAGLSGDHPAGVPAAEKSARSRHPDDPAAGIAAACAWKRCCAIRPSAPWRFRFRPPARVTPLIYIEGIVAASKTSSKPVALAILGDASPLAPDFMAIALKNNVVLSRSSDRTLRAMGKVIGYGNRSAALAKRKITSGSDRCRSRNSDKARNPNGSARRYSPQWAYRTRGRTRPQRRGGGRHRRSRRLSGGDEGAGREA